jgi:hypothetical protein
VIKQAVVLDNIFETLERLCLIADSQCDMYIIYSLGVSADHATGASGLRTAHGQEVLKWRMFGW